MPQNHRSTSAIPATAGMIFIGLLSHMTPLGNGAIQSFRRFGDDLLSQIVVNQLARAEAKYPRSVCYRQSLFPFILSLIIRKSKKTMQNMAPRL